MRKNSKKGFTIVELVIVIAVIAILAAVLIPTFSGIIDKANTSADIQLIREANMLIQAEMIDLDKDLTEEEARKVLEENGIDISKVTNTANVFYYLENEGMYVIFDKDDECITYPEEVSNKLLGWKPQSTIKFNSNGGSAISDLTYSFSDKVTLGKPTRQNYDFVGWKLEAANGSWKADTYASGEELSVGAYGDITLKAEWQLQANKYLIRYHLNDDSGKDDIIGEQYVTYGDSMKIWDDTTELPKLQRKGYSFNGWICSGSEKYRGWNKDNKNKGWYGKWTWTNKNYCIGCHNSPYNTLDLYADWVEN